MLLDNNSMLFVSHTVGKRFRFEMSIKVHERIDRSIHLWRWVYWCTFAPTRRTFPRTITDLHAYTPQISADGLRAKSLIYGKRHSKFTTIFTSMMTRPNPSYRRRFNYNVILFFKYIRLSKRKNKQLKIMRILNLISW